MPTRAPRRCTTPACPHEPAAGASKCADCGGRARRARPSSTVQGYDREHEERFRERVLARDPVCVLCEQRPSVHADHHPRSKKELRAVGLDDHNPMYGRGLCHPCHSKATAQHQPGGWNTGPAY